MWAAEALLCFLPSEGNFFYASENLILEHICKHIFLRQDGVYSGQEVLFFPPQSAVEKDHLDALNLKIKCSTGQLIIPLVWLKYYLTP